MEFTKSYQIRFWAISAFTCFKQIVEKITKELSH